jgi:predicted transcriptional regulator
LLNHGDGERAAMLRAMLRGALADRENSEVIVVRDAAGDILAGVIRRMHKDDLEVPCLRVGRVSALTEAIGRQLVFQQREAAADRGFARVVVTDTNTPPIIKRALADEFFRSEQTTWTSTVMHGIHSAPTVLVQPHDRAAAADFERRHWPVKVIDAGLPTYMVSIEPSFAERLFDANLASATLFPRDPVLGLSREHVYYRSPVTSKNITGPARILWYVKQKRPGHPVGHVRAVSHLIEVAVDRPRTLYNRYARLGVWTQEQVESVAARTGQAMALRFADTELLDRPLSLEDLRNAFTSAGLKFFAPQGPVQ